MGVVTGVVVTQPGAEGGITAAGDASANGVWQDSLFDCMAEPKICIYACFCPYCAFGQTMEAALDKSCCGECCIPFCIDAVTGLGCLYHMCQRGEFRRKYGNLPEAPCCDCCVACMCPLCSTCQMARHQKAHAPGKKGNCIGL